MINQNNLEIVQALHADPQFGTDLCAPLSPLPWVR
jgi:hypothetical protein